jgi:hypothetical protein
MLKAIVDKLSKFDIVELYQQLLHPSKDVIKQRKVKVKVKGSRKRDRVKRYNSWSGKKQLVIDIAGREKYLEGKISYNQAVKHSRNVIKKKADITVSRKVLEQKAYDNIIRLAGERPIFDLWGDEKSPIDVGKVMRHVKRSDVQTLKKMGRLRSYDELAVEAKSSRNKRAVYEENQVIEIFNPYWY